MGNYREIAGLSANALNAFLLPVTDVSSFKWFSLHIANTSTMNGSFSFQASNDNVTVINPVIFRADQPGVTASTFVFASPNIIFHGPLFYHFFSIQIAAFTSGIVNATLELYETPPIYLEALTLAGGSNTIGNVGILGLPTGATQVNSNGTATAGTATATLTGAAGKFTYLTGIEITIIDTATAGSAELSLSGVVGGPLVYEINAQGTVGVESPIIVPFAMPIQSSAVNTSIVATLPTLGAGTGKVSVVAHGYLL